MVYAMFPVALCQRQRNKGTPTPITKKSASETCPGSASTQPRQVNKLQRNELAIFTLSQLVLHPVGRRDGGHINQNIESKAAK